MSEKTTIKLPRILLAAPASGSGKTILTCGILQALLQRGKKVTSFKCGPDYIDPMFHRQVLGTASGNLDLFFTSGEVSRCLLAEQAMGADLAVLEGVMGYYDGIAGTTTHASSYELACETDTPVILILNAGGMSVSLAAYLHGFLTYRKNSRIRGVILNRMSPMLYPRIKLFLEKETGVQVLGYVPEISECAIDSRHLGLLLPEEIPEFQQKLKNLASVLEKTLEIPELIRIAKEAPGLTVPVLPFSLFHSKNSVRIGAARDEAFCFFYPENIRLLEQMGAEIVFFSPLHDPELPKHLDGILFYGGYPELHAQRLSENHGMRQSVQKAIRSGMPVMAECGGFLYLQKELEDLEGSCWSMLGVLPGKGYRTSRLSRFGYIRLEPQKKDRTAEDFSEALTAHEFHYYDCTECGDYFLAKKPYSDRSWSCIHDDGQIFAGFPHFYYYGNPGLPEVFLKRCIQYQKEKKQKPDSAAERVSNHDYS